jgi:arylsulfatase A
VSKIAKKWLAAAWMAAALPVLPALGRQPAQQSRAFEGQRPNIVLILADDLGYGDIGPYGQTRIRTPNLDALARDGVKFTQFYAGTTVCAPSRASLLTGRNTGHTQVRGNIRMGGDFTDENERGQYPLKAGTFTLPGMLRQAGYVTAAIGKWGLGGPGSEGMPTRQGLDYFYGYLDQSHAHNYYPTHLWENETRVPLKNRFFFVHPALGKTSTDPADYRLYQGKDYTPYRIADAAKRFIGRQEAGKPFFLYYAPTLPHVALQVPDKLMAAYKGKFAETPAPGDDYSPQPRPRAARAAMITRLDHEVGLLRAALRRRGLEKNTLILFCSDNGPSSEGGADIGFFNSTGGLRGQKRDLYECGIRSPLIAYWPGHVTGGRSVDTIAAAWDLMPTFAALAGTTIGKPVDGHSFLPALEGRAMAATGPLYWEMHGDDHSAQAARDGRWKAVRWQPGGYDRSRPVELYDLAADPRETRDVSAQHPDVVARMKALFDRRSASPVRQFNFPAPAAVKR